MNQRSYLFGMLWGAFTSLGVLALSYMTGDISRAPYLPAVFFGLQAGSQPAGVDILRYAAISFLSGALLGIYIAKVQRRLKKRDLLAGLSGAGILLIVVLLISLFTRSEGTFTTGFLFWQAALLVCWGWVLSRLVREMSQPATGDPSSPNQNRRMTPRQFRYLVIAGSLTAMISALRIYWMRLGG